MRHDTSHSRQHAQPSTGTAGPPRPPNTTNMDPCACDGIDGCLISPLIPHIPLNPRLPDDTSSEPEETALPREYLAKVWRASEESTRASRLESGASVTTGVAGEVPSLRKHCALSAEDPPAVRQRTDAACMAPSPAADLPGGLVGPVAGTGLPLAAGPAAPVALLAYTNQLYDRLETIVAVQMSQLEAKVSSATESRHIGTLLAKEASEAAALRIAALERRCADLEVRSLQHSAEQRVKRENLETAVAAVSSLIGVAAADAAAARREAIALREMAQKAYSALLADASASINAMKQQIGELKAQQDDLAEAMATWRTTTAVPAVSSESMRASKPQ